MTELGLDLSFHNVEGGVAETTYFEKASFSRIPIVENGQQTMHGLTYQMTAWRHGEEAMDPFHDEVGYLLWEEETGQALRCFAVPRGIGILAGGDAKADSRALTFVATPGHPDYGLVQNKYLFRRAAITAFTSTFTMQDDGSFQYHSDLTMTLAATGGEMHHTDENTLQKVG